MRATASGKELRAAAYAGTHVVTLAWNTATGKRPKRKDLLGYGIERTELDSSGHVVERYWLKGIKRFKDRDKGLPPGTPVSTAEHPIQSFLWADYTAKPDRRYRFRIAPVYGTVKNSAPHVGDSVTLSVRTEAEGNVLLPGSASVTRHSVFFNRGAIGSQAYAREFGNRTPDASNPEAEEMKWLSRGLYEALVDFIALANADGMALRAALYEFHYQPVVNAFAKAVEAGADVKIVYDAESSYKAKNEAAIEAAGLDAHKAVQGRTVTEGIRHNKFIVLMKNGKPRAVWTGSTNISDGGIFGHSNVGHVVWNAEIAAKYLDYWQRLHDNLTPTKLRLPNRTATPTPTGKPAKGSVTPLFSARDDKSSNVTLQWYADRLAEAKQLSCMTFAFNIDQVFQDVLSQQNDVLRYVVKDDPLGSGESIGTDHDVIFAAGAYLSEGALANFLRERSNPLNRNDYIHNKFMLVDPLGSDPLVVTGSANFSRPSQRTNDENMLVIRGDTRVADIYFGEFMRVFDHLYARYVSRILSDQGRSDPNAGYLKPDRDGWLPPHFNSSSYKAKRRKYFVAPQ